MANNKLNLNVGDIPPVPSQKPAKEKKSAKTKSTRPNFGQRIARVFREMISELKKVDWPPMKRTKNNPGVIANTGVVLIVVAFFLLIITAFDFGLAALLKLLTQQV